MLLYGYLILMILTDGYLTFMLLLLDGYLTLMILLECYLPG